MHRKRAAVFTALLVAVLGLGAGYRAVAQSGPCAQNPDNCADQGDGNGQGGGAGGGGGGMSGGDSGSGGNAPGATGQPSGGGAGSAGGGLGGNGSNGSAGGNVDARATPTPEPMSGNSGAPGAGSSASSKSTPTTTASHDPVATSKKASTTPDEVKSWFGATFQTNDGVGGVAKPITVHPDDEVTVFNGATAETQAPSGSGGLRTGIPGVADSKTAGGDTVDVTLHSDPVSLGSAVTDAGGAFSSTVRIPHSTNLGRHFIVALVPNMKDGKTAFVFPVSVEANAQAAAAVDSTQPTSNSKGFPWVLVELLVGTASVVALFVVRVRRASAGIN